MVTGSIWTMVPGKYTRDTGEWLQDQYGQWYQVNIPRILKGLFSKVMAYVVN